MMDELLKYIQSEKIHVFNISTDEKTDIVITISNYKLYKKVIAAEKPNLFGRILQQDKVILDGMEFKVDEKRQRLVAVIKSDLVLKNIERNSEGYWIQLYIPTERFSRKQRNYNRNKHTTERFEHVDDSSFFDDEEDEEYIYGYGGQKNRCGCMVSDTPYNRQMCMVLFLLFIVLLMMWLKSKNML